MKYILIIITLIVTPTLLVSQIKWSSPTVDTVITNRTIKHKNSRRAIITYIKTETYTNTDKKSDIINKIKKNRITLKLNKSNYTYSISTPTISFISKNNNDNIQISNFIYKNSIKSDSIFSYNNSHDTIPSDTKNYIRSIQTLTIILTQINTGNKNITATFSVEKNKTINIKNSIDISNNQFKLYIPSQPLEQLILQPITESITNTLTINTSSVTTNSFTTSVYIYSLQTTNEVQVKFKNSSERRALYETYLFQKKNRGWFYISAGAIGALSNRTVLINEPTYTNDTFINKTKYKEEPIYTINFTGRLGARLKRKHTVFVEGTYLKQGFNVKYDNINPFLGKHEVINAKEYSVTSLLIGLGYNYTRYSTYRHFFFTTDIALYASVHDYTNASNISPTKNRAGFKIAMGVAYKPNYRHDFKLMPTVFYDVSPYTRENIKTRFYSVGFTLSYGLSVFGYK
jgi:hypothetical protein